MKQLSEIQVKLFKEYLTRKSQLALLMHPRTQTFLEGVDELVKEAYISVIADLVESYVDWLGTEEEFPPIFRRKVREFRDRLEQIRAGLPEELTMEEIEWNSINNVELDVIRAATALDETDESWEHFKEMAHEYAIEDARPLES